MRWGPPQPPAPAALVRARAVGQRSPDRPPDPQRDRADGAAGARRGCARWEPHPRRCSPAVSRGPGAAPVPAVTRGAAQGSPRAGTWPPLPAVPCPVAVPSAPSARRGSPPGGGAPCRPPPPLSPPSPRRRGSATPPPPLPPPPLQIESSCGRDSAGPSGKAAHSSLLNSSPRSGAGRREGPGPPAVPPAAPPTPPTPPQLHCSPRVGIAPVFPVLPCRSHADPKAPAVVGDAGGGRHGVAVGLVTVPHELTGGAMAVPPQRPPVPQVGTEPLPAVGGSCRPFAQLSFPRRAQRRRPAR